MKDLYKKTLKEVIKFQDQVKILLQVFKPMTYGYNAKACIHCLICSSSKGNLKSNFSGFNNDWSVPVWHARQSVRWSASVLFQLMYNMSKAKIWDEPIKYLHSEYLFYDKLDEKVGAHGMKITSNLKKLHAERTESIMFVEGTQVRKLPSCTHKFSARNLSGGLSKLRSCIIILLQ